MLYSNACYKLCNVNFRTQNSELSKVYLAIGLSSANGRDLVICPADS